MDASMLWSDGLLDGLRRVGDPELDALMPALMEGRQLEDVNRIMRTYHSNDQPIPEDLPPQLREWLARTAKLPEWADKERIDRASALFVEHGLSMAATLGLVSLLECYAASKGVKALHTTDRMGYSGAERRLGETAQFVVTLMEPGALYGAGRGIPVVLKVRMMHAGARFLIAENDWDAETYGVPANQEDLLGTLMSFAHSPIKSIGKLGKNIRPDEAEDFLHFWRVVGVLLGIPDEVIPRSVSQAIALVDRIAERHFEPSPEGIELTRALLDVFTGLMPGKMLHGGVYAMARYLVGDKICDMLAIPHSRWEIVSSSGGLFGRLTEGIQRRSRVVNSIANKLGWALLNQGGALFTGGRKAAFRIPTEIRRAWRLPPLHATERISRAVPAMVGAIRDAATGVSQDEVAELVTHIGVLVAAADGEIDDFEVAVLAQIFASLGDTGDAGDADTVRQRVERSASWLGSGGAGNAARALARRLSKEGAMNEGLALAIAVAYANSGVAPEERSLIECIANEGGTSGDDLARLVDATRQALDAA